jgi:hypothetical protein
MTTIADNGHGLIMNGISAVLAESSCWLMDEVVAQ